MLSNTEPFNTIFKISKFYGYWQPSLISKSHKVFAAVAFVVFQPSMILFSLFSLSKANNVNEVTTSIAFTFIFTLSTNDSIMFIINNEKIEDFFDYFTEVLDENPKAWESINKICEDFYNSSKRKAKIFVIWFTAAFIGTFTQGSFVNIWHLEAAKKDYRIFIGLGIFLCLDFGYAAFVSFMLQDFSNQMLGILQTFVECFQEELKNMDLKGENGKQNLTKCIKMHQNVKKIMKKYIEIVQYPLGFRIVSSAYLLCTMTFVATNPNSQIEFVSVFMIISIIQQFKPCNIAQQIETGSENFIFSITETNWIDADLKTKSLLVTFMINLIKPTLKLRLFGFIDVNLETFTRNINIAYSTYTVLNSIH
ncbi:hypothetical protein PVAND_003093 [Polypedilum vanderplanki]|uniref:Odorant receptor n=1 Tax=Polypedilum vanderplanki TaxID=319348 RepID=A0A9J6BT22_POLVA|nr:hypothetical protein PVAND_003093 [Polypedilum vanderplanki]